MLLALICHELESRFTQGTKSSEGLSSLGDPLTRWLTCKPVVDSGSLARGHADYSIGLCPHDVAAGFTQSE